MSRYLKNPLRVTAMGLRSIMQRFAGKHDEVYEQMQHQQQAAQRLENKNLSHEELALRKIAEKQRQQRMKRQLAVYQRREDRAYWKDNSVLAQKNMFNNQPSIISTHTKGGRT